MKKKIDEFDYDGEPIMVLENDAPGGHTFIRDFGAPAKLDTLLFDREFLRAVVAYMDDNHIYS